MIHMNTPSGIIVQQGRRGRIFLTKNLVPGKSVYGERLTRSAQEEFREWDIRRSKIGAGLAKGLRDTGCASGSAVLYLGCASGTTVSHLSDIVGKSGIIFAVDVSARAMRDMIFLAKERGNIAPMLIDANHPEELAKRIVAVDTLVQDIAQKHQVAIFLKNLPFLKKGGRALLSIKARSIDVSAAPRTLFAKVQSEISKHLIVEQALDLSPLEKDHMLFSCRKE